MLNWKSAAFALAMVATPTVGVSLIKSTDSPNAILTAIDDASRLDDPSHDPDQQWIFANGIVEGRRREVPLLFELSGRIVEINVAEGDAVTEGKLLARLDATLWQHELSKARASLAHAVAEKQRVLAGATLQARERARAQVQAAEAKTLQAASDWKRAKAMVSKRAIADAEFESKTASYRVCRADVLAARAHLAELEAPPREHEVQAAEANIALQEANVSHWQTKLGKTVLLAPSNGVVMRVDAEPGELIGPDAIMPLLTIVDQSETRVRAYVEELDSMRVAAGQRAYVTADGIPNEQHWGEVVTCLPSMQPKHRMQGRPGEREDTRVREVVIRLDRRTGAAQSPLVTGLPVDVHIQVPVESREWSSASDWRKDTE